MKPVLFRFRKPNPVVRYAYAVLAAAFTADGLARLFAYGAAFRRSGAAALLGAVFTDADGRLLLSAGLTAVLFALSFAAGKRAEIIATALTLLFCAATLTLLSVPLPFLTGYGSFAALGVSLAAFLVTHIAAAVLCVRRAYLNFNLC